MRVHQLQHFKPKSGFPVLKSNSFDELVFPDGWPTENIVKDINSCVFLCGRCHGLARIPMEITKCGHCFCECCILEWINENSNIGISKDISCPVCTSYFSKSDCDYLDEISKCLHRSYNSNEVRCMFNCGTILNPDLLIQHECWFCPNRPVSCPNSNCQFSSTDINMEKHHPICKFRLIYCHECRLPKFVSEHNHNCKLELTKTIKGEYDEFLKRSCFISNMLIYFTHNNQTFSTPAGSR